jgi:hypothetical protein
VSTYLNNAMEQLERQIASAKIALTRLVNKKSAFEYIVMPFNVGLIRSIRFFER